jgi:hypothetical protein
MPAILRSAPEPHGSREATRGTRRPHSAVRLAIQFPGTELARFFETLRVEGVGNDQAARAYSSVGLERTPDKREVGGSNPPRPTRFSATA